MNELFKYIAGDVFGTSDRTVAFYGIEISGSIQ